MNRSDLNKISCKEKNDGIMKRLNKTVTNHKYIRNKNNETFLQSEIQ